MTLKEMIKMMAHEQVRSQKELDQEFGRELVQSFYTVKRNKKTFVVEAELKTGETVRRTIKY